MRIALLTLILPVVFPTLLTAQDKRTFTPSGQIIQKGTELHDKGQYKDAIALYQGVSRSDTNYVWALYEMAMSMTADSQFAKAKEIYQLALSLPQDREREPDLYNSYGSLLDDMDEKDAAIRVFDTAIRKYPNNGQLYLNKGLVLIRQKKYAESEAVLKQGLLVDPYSYSSHYLLGVAALYQGKVIPSFLSFIGYLMVSPEGRYQKMTINLLTVISKNKEDLAEYMENRRVADDDPYRTTEQIVLAKLALDKNYKAISQIDDPICRQIQVLFEKLEYDEQSNDFWMQFYVPIYKTIYNNKEFETFINHIFSGVDLDQIKNYNKRNKKEKEQMVKEIVDHLNLISSTRELNAEKRKTAEIHYYSGNNEWGKGKWKNNGETLIGPWEFYYKTGNLRSKGIFNDAGQREGEWKYYYFNGDLKGVEHYKLGKLEGEIVFYHPNGNISYKGTYVQDKEDGEYNTYTIAGSPLVSVHYKNGNLNGERKEYHPNGMLHIDEYFKNDSLNGPYKSYYDNGILETSFSYLNGRIDGPTKSYHKNGKLESEGTYTKGTIQGELKRYHDNGKLKSIEHYDNGEITGDYEEYFSNGTLHTKYTYKKGKMEGDINYYDDDSKLFVTQTYANNVLKAARYFDKSGKEISKSELKSKKFDLIAYRPDGTKRYQSTMNEKGEVIDRETYYFPSGKINETDDYVDGKLQGTSISYYLNGKKNVEMPYEKGDKEGYYQSRFSNAKMQAEGWYLNNQMEGEWIYYDEQGAKSSKVNLLHDDVDGFKEEFYPNGKIEFQSIYKKGYNTRLTQFDSSGKVIADINMPKGSGKIVLMQHNGKPMSEYSYVNGHMEGLYKSYFPDGSIQTMQYYKNGLDDSTYVAYHYGGKVAAEGKYHLGNKVGEWKNYRANGTLNMTERYENGEVNGTRTYYYENGKVDTEMSFEGGDREGPTKKYSMDGKLLYILNYKQGTAVSYTYPDAAGKLLPLIPIPTTGAKVNTYYANGKLSSSFAYSDGKSNGPDLLFYPDGKPWIESTVEYSNTEGKYKVYYPSGQLNIEYNYENDNLHGPYKEYSEKGTIKEEGNYYNGYVHGERKYYDENGKLKETRIYYYGKLLSVKK